MNILEVSTIKRKIEYLEKVIHEESIQIGSYSRFINACRELVKLEQRLAHLVER